MALAFPPRGAAALAAGLDQLSVAGVDWHGQLCAKQLHSAELAGAFTRGVAYPSAIFATDTAAQPSTSGRFQNPANGYTDAWLRADPQAVYGDAFGTHPQALLGFGQLVDEHQAFCPRAILQREVATLGQLACSVYGAFESEFHRLRETTESLRAKTPAQLARLPELARLYAYVDQSLAAAPCQALRAAALASGVEIESLHTEFTGLLACALAPARGVARAERARLFNAVAKTVARQHGLMAVFMARLAAEFESAGAPLKISLRTLESDDAACYAADSPHPLSPTLGHFVAGLQRYTPELALLICAISTLPSAGSSPRSRRASTRGASRIKPVPIGWSMPTPGSRAASSDCRARASTRPCVWRRSSPPGDVAASGRSAHAPGRR